MACHEDARRIDIIGPHRSCDHLANGEGFASVSPIVCRREPVEAEIGIVRSLLLGKEAHKPGYDAIWHGQCRWNGVAILSRVCEIHETRRGLPGDPHDEQSRYIEAAVGGVLIVGLYLPNGNPRPGPKYDFKLRWFDRLHEHLASLIALDSPVVIAGDYNVMRTDLDVYAPDRWRDDALFAPEVRAAYQRLLDQCWTDALRHLHPDETI
jgi:exodeoxyribonuclease-3